MAVCNTPRVIEDWFISGVGGSTYVDSLRKFKTKNAALKFNEADPESRRAASYIARALSEAGWSVVHSQPPIHKIEDGVSVQTRNLYNPNLPPGPTSEDDSIYAARAIVKFLHSYLWQAKWEPGFAGDPTFPPNSIRILIGLYPPAQFVTPPAMEVFQGKQEKLDEKFESWIREREAAEGELQPCQPVHLTAPAP